MTHLTARAIRNRGSATPGWRRLSALVCLCLLSRAVQAAAGPGPLVEWRFDEGSGDVARDGSGNGHDATLHSVAGMVSCELCVELKIRSRYPS